MRVLFCAGTVALCLLAPDVVADPIDIPPPSPPASAAAVAQPYSPPAAARLAEIEKQQAAMNAALEKVSRLRFAGYVQGRYEWHDDANFGLDANGKPRETSRFSVRRIYLKTTHTSKNSEFLMQIGGSGEGITLKDAEATLIDTWSPFSARLTVGQFKVPFGFELVQSSADRELPERVLAVRTFFPGDRDRGVRLFARYQQWRLAVALINGNGVVDPIYGSYDQTSFKDVVGRLGADFRFLVLGLSGYYGHTLPTMGLPTAPTYSRFRRVRFGADSQVYLTTPGVGALALRAEIFISRDSSLGFSGAPPDSCHNVRALGWYATVVQSFGTRYGAALRIDQFDPNGGLSDTCMDYAAAGHDRITTLGATLFVFVSENLKASAAYEHLAEQAPNTIANDIVTLQLQSRF